MPTDTFFLFPDRQKNEDWHHVLERRIDELLPKYVFDLLPVESQESLEYYWSSDLDHYVSNQLKMIANVIHREHLRSYEKILLEDMS